MKKNFVIMLAVVLMISVLIGCGNRIDEKFIPNSTFYSLEGNSLAISVEWPAVNGQKSLSAAPPVEFNIGTIEIALINLSEWQEFSEEYNLEEMDDNLLLSYLSFFFRESENVIVKSYDVKPGSPNRDGAELNDIKTGTYILYIAGVDADTSLTTFFALKENIIVADDKTTKVTVTSSDWLGDTETGGENGYILNVFPSNSTYVLSPEPDNDGYYEEGTVVTVTAAPEAGNHFCYFKYSGQAPFLGSVLPNSTTITMNSDKILNIVSSPGEYVVYVSDDNGNDLNNGLNPLTPVKTPEKAVEIVDLIIAENSGQVAPAPSMAGGLALEVGIEVRLEGSVTGQTYINNNPEKKEVFYMDSTRFFSISGGWNYSMVEAGSSTSNITIVDGQAVVRHITIDNVENFDTSPVINISYLSLRNRNVFSPVFDGTGGSVYIEQSDVNINTCEFLQNSIGTMGGALYIHSNSAVDITGCRFFENTSANQGSAIYSMADSRGDVELSIAASEFLNNTAGQGACISYEGYLDGVISVAGCNFTSNSNSSGQGGAMFVSNAVELNISGSFFETNHATFGAGAVGVQSVSTVNIFTTEFNGNESVDSETQGGALSLEFCGTANLIGVNFSGNKASMTGADGFGGAIYAASTYSNKTQINITDVSTFEENEAGSGGAIYASDCNLYIDNSSFTLNKANQTNIKYGHGGAVQIEIRDEESLSHIKDCSFTDNTSNWNGGALYVSKANDSSEPSAHLVLEKNTFTDNQANLGGGVYIGAYFEVLTVDSSGIYDVNSPWNVMNIPSANDGNAAGYQNTFSGNINNEIDANDGNNVYFCNF